MIACKSLLLTITAIIVAIPFTAYSAEGVHWNGGAYLRSTRNNNTNYNYVTQSWASWPKTHAGMCSYWFSSSPSTASKQQTLFAVYPNLIAPIPDATPSVLIEHVPWAGTTRLHLKVQVPGVVPGKMDIFSAAPIKYWAGATETYTDKHHYMVYWDTNQGAVRMQFDGAFVNPDNAISSISGIPFSFVGDGAAWTHGALLIPGSMQGAFVPTQFLNGDTNESFCILGDDIFIDLTATGFQSTPHPPYFFPIFFLIENNTMKGPLPRDLGFACTDLFTEHNEWPYICMRGDPPYYQANSGTGNFALFGVLTPAAFSPFDLDPVTKP